MFVGNCGLGNNIGQEMLEDTFVKFGQIVDVVMGAKKPYSFVIFEEPQSTLKAINELQGKVITCNQTPICFYLFAVDRGKVISHLLILKGFFLFV